MYCTNCGRELNDNTKFCGSCGIQVGLQTINLADNSKETQPIPQVPKKDVFGVLDSAFDKAIETVDNLSKSVGKLSESVDKHNQSDSEDWGKYFKKESGTEILVFDRKSPNYVYFQDEQLSQKIPQALVDKFIIYDENRGPKYPVNGRENSRKRQLEVFDSTGKCIGLLKEKLFVFQSFSLLPSIMRHKNLANYSVELFGKKLGMIKSKRRFFKRSFSIGFNDWNIKGKFYTGNFSVYNGKDEIAKVRQESGVYVLTFYDKRNEHALLMVVLALFSDYATKKSDIRRTRWRRAERNIEKTTFWFRIW